MGQWVEALQASPEARLQGLPFYYPSSGKLLGIHSIEIPGPFGLWR